eukprot:m.1128893 g.1128893  ORF g.1128893 m.1128893 type:complete len:1486 (+) comp24414_c0_seq2:267-4724(+)
MKQEHDNRSGYTDISGIDDASAPPVNCDDVEAEISDAAEVETHKTTAPYDDRIKKDDDNEDGSNSMDNPKTWDCHSKMTTLAQQVPKEISTFGHIKFSNFNDAIYFKIDDTIGEFTENAAERYNALVGLIQKWTADTNTNDATRSTPRLPRLLLSIVGGAADPHLSPELTQLIERGMSKLTDYTQFWGLTVGTASGVAKKVGEMANVSNVGRSSDRRIPLIGIPTFETVVAADDMHGARCFHFGEDVPLNEQRDIMGDVNRRRHNKEGYPAKLDENHHIFLLYSHQRPAGAASHSESFWGKEEKFRDGFENHIREHRSTQTRRNPFNMTANVFSVLVVIEGGPVTLQIAETAALSGKPVVIVEGSGRAADAIAYVWRYLHDKRPLAKTLYTRAGIRKVIQAVGHQTDAAIDVDFGRILRMVCVRSKITLCTVDECSNENRVTTGLDKAIHAAIHRAIPFSTPLKSEIQETPGDGSETNKPVRAFSDGACALLEKDPFKGGLYCLKRAQLWWALLFNELDVAKDLIGSVHELTRTAKQQILTDEWTRNLEQVLVWGLVDGSVHGNVAELVVSKLNLYEFVQKKSETDATLYVNLNSLFHEIISCKGYAHLGALAKEFYKSDFQPDRNVNYVTCMNDVIAKLVGLDRVRPLGADVDNARNAKTKQDAAYRDLLLWAVLCVRPKLAEFFWRAGGQSISVAIFAVYLLRQMSTSSALSGGSYKKICEKMDELADVFESNALGVLEVCQAQDEKKTHELLREKLHHLKLTSEHEFNVSDSLSLMSKAECYDLIKSPASLAAVEQEWHGAIDLAATSWVAIVLSALFPCLLFCPPRSWNYFFVVRFGDNDDKGTDGQSRDCVCTLFTFSCGKCRKRLSTFYRIPLVKFYLDLLSHLGFILVFTWSIFTDYAARSLTASEVVVAVWMAGFFLQQVFYCAEFGLGFYDSQSHGWDILNMVTVVVYVIGVAVRFLQDDNVGHAYGKIIVDISLTLQYWATLKFYSKNSVLGPKIIMLKKMTYDILTFLALMIVFLASSGVAFEVILQPTGTTFGDVMFVPSFQMFGDSYLELLAEQASCDIRKDNLDAEAFRICASVGHEFLPLMAWVYLMISNVVLVNLLIAMMGRTYDDVQDKAYELWHLQSYELLVDYKTRNTVPMPVGGWYQGCKAFLHWCRDNECAKRMADAAYFNTEKFMTLEGFQEKCTEIYLRERDTVHKNTAMSDFKQQIDRVEQMLLIMDARMTSERVDREGFRIVKDLSTSHSDVGIKGQRKSAVPTYCDEDVEKIRKAIEHLPIVGTEVTALDDCVLLSRFKRDAGGERLLRDDRRVLEVLMVRTAEKTWALPSVCNAPETMATTGHHARSLYACLGFADSAACTEHSQDVGEFLSQQLRHPPLQLPNMSTAEEDGGNSTLKVYRVNDRHDILGRTLLTSGAEWVVASKHVEYARHMGRDVLAVLLEHEMLERGACWLDHASRYVDSADTTAVAVGQNESAA